MLLTMHCLFVALAFGQPDDPRPELRPFVGSWELIETVRDGKPQDVESGERAVIYVFKPDGTYIGKIGDSVLGKGTYRPIAGKSAIDWTAAGRKEFDGSFTKEYPSVGIYRIDGDTLTIVLKLEGKPDQRPTEFASKPGSEHTLLKLRRSKPAG